MTEFYNPIVSNEIVPIENDITITNFKYIINISQDIKRRIISFETPNLDGFGKYTINWDYLNNQHSIEVPVNTAICWIINNADLYIMNSINFMNACIFDETLKISETNSNIMTILSKPGHYHFSSKYMNQCNNNKKITIIVK